MDSTESRLLVNGHGIKVISSLTLIKLIMVEDIGFEKLTITNFTKFHALDEVELIIIKNPVYTRPQVMQECLLVEYYFSNDFK